MDELLTPEQSQLRDSAARLCAEFGGAKRARTLRDGRQELDADAWRAIRKAGWLATLVPEERGGLGLGAAELYVLLEQIGRQTLMVPMLETAAVSYLLGGVRGPAADAAMQSLLSGDQLIIPALQADGWDFRRRSQALAPQSQGNAMRLNGIIAGVAFAPSADEFLVHAEISGEAMLYLVARETPGCQVSVTSNVDGSTSSTISFANVVADAAGIIARGQEAEALGARMGDLLALGAAIELLGLAETAHAMTLDHIRTRKQFGHPLGSFQALQHRMVDGFVDIELDRALLHRIALAWDAGTALPAMVAAAKSRSSRNAAEIMRTGLQLHGAIGYTDEHDIGIFFKRALVLAARYGNEFTQLDRFARLTEEET